MTLTSSSDVTAALAQYNDNLNWEGDTAKAQLALEAVRFLLVNRGTMIATEGRSINYAGLEQEKAKLESYVSRVAVTSGRSSFTRGRMIR